jgi:hypothetical protein
MKYDNVEKTGINAKDVTYTTKDAVFIINIIHLVYIGILICIFTAFKAFEVRNSGVLSKETSKLIWIYNTLRSILNSKIFPLIWNFVCGVIATIDTQFNFVYALQMFSIISIFPVMKAAITSLILKYVQFLSTALLIIIICIIYGSLSIFFLNAGMKEKDSKKATCETFIQCTLHIMNWSIRNGQIGFPIKKYSETNFWPEFIVDWTFYLSVILILLNFINGIIVDTFNELYEDEIQKVQSLDKSCFICSLTRSKYDVHGLDFEKHKFVDHYLQNYFYYIAMIKKEDPQELNARDYQVLLSINNRRTDFIPFMKAVDMIPFEDDNEDEEAEEKASPLLLPFIEDKFVVMSKELNNNIQVVVEEPNDDEINKEDNRFKISYVVFNKHEIKTNVEKDENNEEEGKDDEDICDADEEKDGANFKRNKSFPSKGGSIAYI